MLLISPSGCLVVDTVLPKSKKFVTGVKIKATAHYGLQLSL